MSVRAAPHQSDVVSQQANHPRVGNVKATRQDWIDAAVAALERVAIDQLKILSLAEDLSVSRSSFYWYFDGIAELHEELLAVWSLSTAAIVERTQRRAQDITTACLGVYECWADASLYSSKLDFAIRDWGRRNADISIRVYHADVERLNAMSDMFEQFGFDETDAMVRARLLYHSQLGYYATGTDEAVELRLMFLPSYLRALTDVEPEQRVLDEFAAYFRKLQATP